MTHSHTICDAIVVGGGHNGLVAASYLAIAVGTERPRIVLAGTRARRGGGVSGIAGQYAAMALLAKAWSYSVKYKSLHTTSDKKSGRYGLMDQNEFFAEKTGCYFGWSDYYLSATGQMKQASPVIVAWPPWFAPSKVKAKP